MKTAFILALASCSLASGALASCAGTQSEAELPAAEAPDESEPEKTDDGAESAAEDARSEPEQDSDVIPESCAGGGVCVPPDKWVKRLCNGVFQDVALYMFRKGTPWQRMYLTRETEAVNASGGATVSGTLAFDEEVLILRHRGGDKNGIQIGAGGGNYDALRWNGSCVSLEAEELTNNTPPKAKTSRVEWRWLSKSMQKGLREDPTINETYRARRQECKGATMGSVTKKCETLDKKLVAVVVDYVRGSETLPAPGDKP